MIDYYHNSTSNATATRPPGPVRTLKMSHPPASDATTAIQTRHAIRAAPRPDVQIQSTPVPPISPTPQTLHPAGDPGWTSHRAANASPENTEPFHRQPNTRSASTPLSASPGGGRSVRAAPAAAARAARGPTPGEVETPVAAAAVQDSERRRGASAAAASRRGSESAGEPDDTDSDLNSANCQRGGHGERRAGGGNQRRRWYRWGGSKVVPLGGGTAARVWYGYDDCTYCSGGQSERLGVKQYHSESKMTSPGTYHVVT